MGLKLATAFLLSSFLLAPVLWMSHERLLNWDEVDYVNAARLGVWVNMADANSLDVRDYYSFARAKASNQAPQLPESYSEQLDTLYLRHLHPPLVAVLLTPLADSKNERVIRFIQVVGALLLIGSMLYGYSLLSANPTWAGAFVVAALAVWCAWELFATLSFHGWVAIGLTMSAALASAWLSTGSARYGIGLCIALAFSVLSLESGLFVFALVAAIVLSFKMKAICPAGSCSWSRLLLGSLLVAAICFVFWPGSLLKISIVKIVFHYAYRLAVVRREYEGVPERWRMILQVLGPMMLVALASITSLWFSARDEARRWAPFAFVGCFYALIMLPFAISNTYILPATGAIACLAGCWVDHVQRFGKRSFAATAVVALLVLTAPTWPTPDKYAAEKQEMSELGQMIAGKRAFIDGGHICQYYLGDSADITPFSLTYDGRFVIRVNGAFRDLTRTELADKIVIVRRGHESSLHLSDEIKDKLPTHKVVELSGVYVYVPKDGADAKSI